ncbi:MAG: LysR family transcriptional regulator [Bradymonadia bacterium]
MELDELRAFVAVVDVGSLSGAAQATGTPRSTLRRRLESLEDSLNCPLFVDKSRPQMLTQRGRALEELARRLLMHAEQVESSIRGTIAPPEQTVVVIIQTGLSHLLAFSIAEMLRSRNPRLNFGLRIRNDALATLAHEGDFAITLNTEIPEEGVWITRKLVDIPLRLRISDMYIARKGRPETIEDLAKHDIVTCSMVGPRDTLPLIDGGTMPVSPVAITDDIAFCDHAALTGYAIALSPPPMSHPAMTHMPTLHTLFEDVIGIDITCRIFAPGGLSSRPQIADVVQGLVEFTQGMDL